MQIDPRRVCVVSLRAMSLVVARYHEITLKRGNRARFAGALIDNIRRLAADLPLGKIADLEGRIVAVLRDDACWPELRERLARVYGVANFSFARSLPTRALGDRDAPDLRPLGEAILAALSGVPFTSFRIATKRADKRFPMSSPEVGAALAEIVPQATGARVNLEDAELTV